MLKSIIIFQNITLRKGKGNSLLLHLVNNFTITQRQKSQTQSKYWTSVLFRIYSASSSFFHIDVALQKEEECMKLVAPSSEQ